MVTDVLQRRMGQDEEVMMEEQLLRHRVIEEGRSRKKDKAVGNRDELEEESGGKNR